MTESSDEAGVLRLLRTRRSSRVLTDRAGACEPLAIASGCRDGMASLRRGPDLSDFGRTAVWLARASAERANPFHPCRQRTMGGAAPSTRVVNRPSGYRNVKRAT